MNWLLLAAAAALLWPRPRAAGRLRPPRARPWTGPGTRSWPAVPPTVTAGAAAVAAALLSGSLLVAGLAATVGAVAARAVRAGRRRRRDDLVLARLTDGLAAVAADLRSGRPVAPAAAAAAEACGDPRTGGLLAAALRGLPAGGAVDPAGTGARPGAASAALDRIAAGAALSARTGCSLAAVATAVEGDLRARARLHRSVRSAVAGPLAGARVLAGLPALGLAMGHGVGADPWRVLTTTGTGQVLLVAGVGLELAGLAWVRAITERAVR